MHEALAIAVIVCAIIACAIAARDKEYKSSTPWFFTAFALAAIALVGLPVIGH